MKKKYNINTMILSLIFFITIYLSISPAISPGYADSIINVSECTQEYNQWCWAGSSWTVLSYYGKKVRQCELAEFARNANYNMGNTNCCQNANRGCNQSNIIFGYGGIDDILDNWGVASDSVYSSLSIQKARSVIDNGRPFIIRWGYYNGGGHFIVGHGIAGSKLYYMDPWYNEGKKIAEFSWVTSNSSKRWTHTLVATTIPQPQPSDELIIDNMDVNTYRRGLWYQSSGANPWRGQSVYCDRNGIFRWMPDIQTEGYYAVYAWWTYHQNRGANVPYTIRAANSNHTVFVNQKNQNADSKWQYLGNYYFTRGDANYIEVSAQNGQACADAVRLILK